MFKKIPFFQGITLRFITGVFQIAFFAMISNERNFSLAINGERTCGQEIRNQNVTAVMSIANVVKSSLGPVGLDKMLVDNIGVRKGLILL